MITNGFKNTFLILNILIFNLFFSQTTEKKNIINKDTLIKNPSDSLIRKPSSIVDLVKSKADSSRSDIPNKMSYLKRNAMVSYQDMIINADYISIDWKNNVVFARGALDSLGKIISPAVANQGGKKYEYDSFSYNLKTKVAMAYNARTEESEGVIVAKKTKKVNDSVFFMRSAKYTTDDYFLKKKDTLSDYYMYAPLLKLVKGKQSSKVISGPIQLYVEDVPTPLALPFAILPFSEKRSAGILIPSFGENQATGFFLQNMGYYQPLGKHMDLKLYFDYSTKGSYAIRPEFSYKKIYKYSGSFKPDFSTTVNGIYGLPSYVKSQQFRIFWSHIQDAKANPYFKFNASVDIVNSRNFYNRSITNNYVFNNNVLNTRQNSSVSIIKNFVDKPFSISATFRYDQNFTTKEIDMTLPQVNVNINQFYLFKPKSGIRTGLLENINVTTSLRGVNNIKTTEDEVMTKAMFDKLQLAIQNPISLTTSTNVFKFFTFSLNADANSVITNKTTTKSFDATTSNAINTTKNGISAFTTFNTSASLQTILYGIAKFGKTSKIQAIRHMLTPSLSFNYTPDFSSAGFGYYSTYQNNLNESISYSRFEGNPFGSPGQGLSQAVSLSINNNLEMKIKSKKDSTGVRKIKIFENLGITTGYNFAASNYKLSPINITGQTNLIEKLNLNFGMTIDPYKIIFEEGQQMGTRLDKIGAFNISSFNAQFSFPLSNLLFGKEKDYNKLYKKKGEIMNENYYFDEDNYAAFSQSWTLDLRTSYNYSNQLMRQGTHTATIGMNGSLKLSPHWSITGTGDLDLIAQKMAFGRFTLSRNLRSFQFNFNWSPFGLYKVYDFAISIKANILKDAVKYNERSFNQNNSSF